MHAFELHPQNNSIMPKIMLKKCNYAQLILAVFDALFHPHRHIFKHHFIASVVNFKLAAKMDRQLPSLRTLTE